MNIKVAEKICDVFGNIIHSTDMVEIDGGNFMRVRVKMNVSLPLYRGRVISLEKGENKWITFRYEHLPNICYWCGCFMEGYLVTACTK